jgi:hypothetical protein
MDNSEETLFWIIQTCYPTRPIIYTSLQRALDQAQPMGQTTVYEYKIGEDGFPVNHGSHTFKWDGLKRAYIWEYYRFD